MEPRSRTNPVASLSWSLQARARRLTRREKASATPMTPPGSPPSTRRLGPPVPAPLVAHGGSRRAISAERYTSAASPRGGRTGRLRAAPGLGGGSAWLLTRKHAPRSGRWPCGPSAGGRPGPMDQSKYCHRRTASTFVATPRGGSCASASGLSRGSSRLQDSAFPGRSSAGTTPPTGWLHSSDHRPCCDADWNPPRQGWPKPVESATRHPLGRMALVAGRAQGVVDSMVWRTGDLMGAIGVGDGGIGAVQRRRLLDA
jgi:hypothetical protein